MNWPDVMIFFPCFKEELKVPAQTTLKNIFLQYQKNIYNCVKNTH